MMIDFNNFSNIMMPIETKIKCFFEQLIKNVNHTIMAHWSENDVFFKQTEIEKHQSNSLIKLIFLIWKLMLSSMERQNFFYIVLNIKSS